MRQALSLLNILIDNLNVSDEASNTLGGNASYFYNKLQADADLESNSILAQALNEYSNIKGNKQLEKELETKYIFAFFIRHYRDKAHHIKEDKTDLKQYILNNIMSGHVRSKIDVKAEKLLSDIQQSFAMATSENKYHSNCQHWSLRDTFLVELGHWFNTEFMEWFKPKCPNPKCTKDDAKMEYTEMMDENEMVRVYGNDISRVHLYRCSNCGETQHFLRFYQCDAFIRGTVARRGWCGDHCDVFAAIINALGFEWRFALDDTDHIWIEIYSQEREKWCCFEPSPETDTKRYDFNKFADRKSRYIHAIDGSNQFPDVTHRYHSDAEIVQKRRNEHCISEEWVSLFLKAESRVNSSQ